MTAAYPPQTGLIYNANTLVKYVGGATVIFPYGTVVNFPFETEFYVKEGPSRVVADTNVTFGSSVQVTFAPGMENLPKPNMSHSPFFTH